MDRLGHKIAGSEEELIWAFGLLLVTGSAANTIALASVYLTDKMRRIMVSECSRTSLAAVLIV